jgi:hypothetical protein
LIFALQQFEYIQGFRQHWDEVESGWSGSRLDVSHMNLVYPTSGLVPLFQ